MTVNDQKIPLLVVEDSVEDFEVLERAFRKAEFDIPLHRCKSGEEAISLLYREGEYEFYPKNSDPSMILLDLNMPGLGGQALLENVKDDDRLRHIPIIVLSTSSNNDDITLSYKNGANSYIQKPSDMHGYVDMVKNIKDYWFTKCSLPRQGAQA